jgi:hypothetical protein
MLGLQQAGQQSCRDRQQMLLGLATEGQQSSPFPCGAGFRRRQHILAGTFQEFRRQFVAGYKTRTDAP